MTRWVLVVAWLAGLCASGSRADAQARPTVFIHGFGAEAADWAATADRLKARVAIAPHLPKVSWREKFETQGKQVESQLSSLATNSIAVGHSNGGVVAREWSRLRQLGGIVTIGTPHKGVPLLANLPGWAAFTGTTRGMVGQVFSAFRDSSDWTAILAIVESALLVASDYSVWSLTNLISVLGVTAVTPVMPQMTPNSSYLTTLNGSSNLTTEASRAPQRVGIVSVASNFDLAGPARAIAPDQADQIATTIYGVSATLLFWGNYILLNADPSDFDAIDQALALIAVSNQILAIDPTYCRMVSRVDMAACGENDGLVPVSSQSYPGAPNFLIHGPAHRREKQQSDDAFYAALVNYMNLTPGAYVPPPAPPPTPPPSGPMPGDPSGVIVYRGELDVNERLWPGDMVNSADGRLHFVYQADGNLVLYFGAGTSAWEPLWATDTDGTSAGFVAMQGDGNLVVYNRSSNPVWSSDTFRDGSWLVVQNDGNVVIYSPGGGAVWSTDTFVD
jgi:pimeloyl-ACP methyl ester carboxylesterase